MKSKEQNEERNFQGKGYQEEDYRKVAYDTRQ